MAKGSSGESRKEAVSGRRKKLAAELRANLRKRKDQARMRSTSRDPVRQTDLDPCQPGEN